MAKQKEEKTKNKKLLAIILLSLSFCFVVSGMGHGEIIIPQQSRMVGELIVDKLQEDEYKNEPLWPYIERIRGEMLEEIGLLKLYNNLLTARIHYMMRNPNSFLYVTLLYDKYGVFRSSFPKSVDMKSDMNSKIIVTIVDNRDVFSDKSGIALLDEFKRHLEVVYSYVSDIATNLDNDIGFFSKKCSYPQKLYN